ncbi:MAG: undecaprenyl-diphosphate phosphatase [Candidatus Hydrothermarchaeales archaeon]
MNVLEGMFLGVLQGITEWLPISSSGQSMLFLINIFHIAPEEAFSIAIMLHLGSLFAVVFYFREKLRNVFLQDRKLLSFLIVGTIASGVVGLPVYVELRNLFSSVSGEAVTMLIGVMLIVTGMVLKNTKKAIRQDFNTSDALIVGGAQGIAVLPGISRSGTTIAALLLRGVEQETALSLSFLLAIPAILGLVVIESSSVVLSVPVLVGVATSFVVSLAAMHYFLALAKKVDFSNFCIAVGALAFFVPLFFIALEGIL